MGGLIESSSNMGLSIFFHKGGTTMTPQEQLDALAKQQAHEDSLWLEPQPLREDWASQFAYRLTAKDNLVT